MAFLSVSFSYAQIKKVQPSTQRIESFNSEKGFNQNTVSAIISDSKGYLWVATPNGLVRYDGYSFEYYYHDHENEQSLTNNYVSHLLSDSKGRVWVVTSEGINIYLTDKEQFLSIKKTTKKAICIKEDSNNRVFVGGDKKIEVYYSGHEDLDRIDKITEINLEKVLGNNVITDIEFYSDTELIVATSNKIYKVDFNENTNYAIGILELELDESIDNIKKIIKVDNSLWVGTNSGLYQMFHENSRLITVGSHFTDNPENSGQQYDVLSLYLDKEKKLWIGTRKNGIVYYDTNKTEFKSFKFDSRYNNGLTSNRINCFFEDAFGVLWIGTAQGGLNKLDKNQKPFQNYWHNPYDDTSLSGNLITDITEASDGRIWMSFFESTICRTEKKLNIEKVNQIHFNRLEEQLSELKDQWVLRIYQDNKGYWWISTSEGIYLYDEKKDILKKIQIRIEGELVNPIFYRLIEQMNADQIILGGSKILMLDNPWKSILNNKPIETVQLLFDIGDNNQINEYLKDDFGNFWFATINGVYRVTNNNDQWLVKNHLTSSADNEALKLSNNRVFSIHKDLNKNIWLGTFGGGLMKIQLNALGEPVLIKGYHKKDGLRDEAIYGILEDDKEQLWLSTDMGIGHFDPVNETFDFYDVNNGILSNNFRQSAYLKTKSGTMLMGGVNGLTIFNPNQINKNEITPKILISRLKINNQPIVVGQKVNNKVVLERSISDTKELVVGNDSRNLSLDIIVQHSATPNKNKLAYKLEGVNTDWIEIDAGKATATYTNLSPGIYNFLYKGANGDGVWTANTESFTIDVLAPWYARWWSIALAIILVILITYGVFKYLVKVEKLNQKLKFEQLDKERVRDMNQAKLRFFTNISHDFKTPLSLIIGPLEKIAEQNNNQGTQKYFSIIENNISRLQRLIDQLISYRKAETGHLELNYSKITLGNFIYPLMEAFEEYSQKTLLNFYYKIDEPNKLISLDINKTERVLLNLFSNAVKYSNLNREVNIEAGFIENNGNECLFIQVTNTSDGIPVDKVDRVFDRFYRCVDEKNDWSGTGIGLALCKSLIELMHGSIEVTSEVGKKTSFRIELPVVDKGEYLEEGELNKYQKLVTDWLPAELESAQDETLDVLRPTILVVDDEQDVRSFLYESFKSKYNVLVASDGEEGLEKIQENPPQLVISDVMMPKLNGYDFCEKIKSSIEFCHIPVILLTAMGDDLKEIKGLELGADDYVVKPFSIKYLEVRVKTLIENKQRIFAHFSRNSSIPKDSLMTSSRDKQFLQKINISIEKNMSNSAFGVEELATDIGMSTSHFYRKLKELTGQAPNVYLRNFRLQKAAQLLAANKNLTAADIMFEIGIESKSYFSSTFKKIHGVSPSEFTKKTN
ncbi:response regulator [Lacinutrix sp. C3R15]|uniref:hybrid sensor histidine kinase/response regulator transcription factor n=1 Tax=Flavobacteriaceae TaxID=49546 RepID=UPI001C0A18C5|nr:MULTISPECIES: two-component regulator propeller domain-containing protein [Flavobacteriaceae]MBU2939182.1 response regulator [Lacinutrix sp. C3R15]MDO6622498.1 two-component regulator propeller domain-containing protein [Oceanihabitans sp. 1_MG-2023]